MTPSLAPNLGFPPLRLLKDRRIKPKGQIHPLQSTNKQLKLQLFVKRSVQRFRDLTIQHNKKRTRYLKRILILVISCSLLTKILNPSG